jgi:hypothetical protein
VFRGDGCARTRYEDAAGALSKCLTRTARARHVDVRVRVVLFAGFTCAGFGIGYLFGTASNFPSLAIVVYVHLPLPHSAFIPPSFRNCSKATNVMTVCGPSLQ